MIEIKVNDEVRDVKSEFLMGLNLHQLIWCGMGLLFTGVTGFLLYLYTPVPLIAVTYLCVILTLPFGGMAFLTWHEMNGIDAARLYVTRHLIDPIIKTYGSSNYAFVAHIDQGKKEEKAAKKRGKRNCKKEAEVNPSIVDTVKGGRGFNGAEEERKDNTNGN